MIAEVDPAERAAVRACRGDRSSVRLKPIRTPDNKHAWAVEYAPTGLTNLTLAMLTVLGLILSTASFATSGLYLLTPLLAVAGVALCWRVMRQARGLGWCVAVAGLIAGIVQVVLTLAAVLRGIG